mmetsp:Transcript_28736/g.46288  ORF Transcript_28736/g.46288 Transcript_28736/m.46288 type:complete len:805 (+) Transcript_28736:70-2484(+)
MEVDRIQRARDRARDAGLYFCVVCDHPIRGKTFYSKGAACHFGCGGADLGELQELEELQPCQELALKNVREATKSLHDAALPRLRHRMATLGFQPADVGKTLEWVRDRAPIIVHVDLAAYGMRLARDTHYRNQFETNTSRGTLCHATRARWEGALFDAAYADARPEHRCKYGVLNVTNDPQGVRKCRGYGASYFLLRNVRLRTTFAANDSAGINIEDIATVDYYAHVLEKYSDAELKSTVQVASGHVFCCDSEVITHYKEAQIHGDICLAENVELIMLHPSMRADCHAEMLRQLSARCKAPLVWMEGFDDENVFEGETSPCEDSIDGSTASPSHHTTISHDGFDDNDLLKAIEASKSLPISPSGLEASGSSPIVPASSDGFDENDLLKAIEASRTSLNEEKLLADTREASELEAALELSKSSHEDCLSLLCTSCSNGCGRLRADGYKTCCRTCTDTGGKRHGPTCDEDFAIRASLSNTCRNGCSRAAVTGSVLCARCKEEEELIEQAIQASIEVGDPQQCVEKDDLERAMKLSIGVEIASDLKFSDGTGLDEDADLYEATIPAESLAVEKEEETFHDVLETKEETNSEADCALSQTTHVLKAKLKDDTRRVQVSWDRHAVADDMLQGISQGVRHVFGLTPSVVFVLSYKDECDGEMLTLAETTVEDFLASQNGPLRIFVNIVEDARASPLSVSDIEVDADEPAKLLDSPSDVTATRHETAKCHLDQCCTVLESGKVVDPPVEPGESNEEHEHFIGHDLSNWDDFEHVADPLEEWYDNPAVVVVAASDGERNAGDTLEDKAEIGC